MNAYLGMFICVCVLSGMMFSIAVLLHKKAIFWALILLIILVLALPIMLNEIITRGWYSVIPCESRMEPEEWFSFFGSYIGVLGTIVMGAVACWQVEINRKQDAKLEEQRDKLAKLQSRIDSYKMKPVIYFESGHVRSYGHDSRNENINRAEYEKLYYSINGKKCRESSPAFLYGEINYRDLNIIPIEEVKVSGLRWEISGHTYEMEECAAQAYTFTGEKIRILIAPGLMELRGNGDDKMHDFLEDVDMHQHYCGAPNPGYDQSELVLKLLFLNQMQESQSYELSYGICSEETKDELFLRDPHIVRVSGESKEGKQDDTTER